MVSVKDWPESTHEYIAETRAKAIYKALLSATDAGYRLKWIDFSARLKRIEMERDK